MSRWTPCKRRDFIRRARRLGFEGPFTGTRHQFMVYQHHRLAVPSHDEYTVPQLKMMLREIETLLNRQITLEEWQALGEQGEEERNIAPPGPSGHFPTAHVVLFSQGSGRCRRGSHVYG